MGYADVVDTVRTVHENVFPVFPSQGKKLLYPVGDDKLYPVLNRKRPLPVLGSRIKSELHFRFQ